MSGKAKKKVGLIGCGAIGTVLAEAIERKLVVCDELVVYDIDRLESAETQGRPQVSCDNCEERG